MTFNRKNQLQSLEKLYNSTDNEAVVFYSAIDSDLNEIMEEFLSNKDFFYYKSVQVSPEEQVRLFVDSINSQLTKRTIEEETYSEALKVMLETKCEKRVIVIDEFQHIVKYSTNLIDEIFKCINNKWGNQPVLFILTSTNLYFNENQLVEKLGDNAYQLSGIITLSDLSFTDIVNYFDKYSTEDRVIAYALTGGRARRVKSLDNTISLKENIINNILNSNSLLYNRGLNMLPPELREHSVYNTILFNLAAGNNKLNDLHKNTWYSRAKISVYLNNLMEHDLIEKIESYDSDGRDNTIKGVYAIKDGFLEFFYRFIYPDVTMLEILPKDKFYKSFIAPYLNDFSCNTFRKVCLEYIKILGRLNKLPINISKTGIWLGKVGTIDIVASDDKGNTIIGLCEFKKDYMTYEDFEWLQFCVKQAKISGDYYYLFAKKGFDDRIKEFANIERNVVLIDLNML